ncbi:alpha,alpha-trehalose-phosphate synthase (UDP-forming) [Denitratisoma oestradiolicum]|uniref:Trehalose-6-phosphate synthase n=1 Tax=Denitratisoma oestradiolicum TaxID=311182 RepID=A0A6S6XQ14_9PROT|nr:trehalose-6-phosphate synthase [Denitratisoma oestradiolicum]TWO79386.1 trehalose-6-phosphate synthase [Denitratisoma oestradiolicum]CAB1368001.1 Trehalose-6-phosphate synthase [Denitratisoma oestradiolicum]
MRLSLRFVLPLILILAAFAYGIVPLVDQLTFRWFVRDLDMRSALIVNTIQEPLQEQLAAGSKAKTAALFTKITQDERIFAIGYCATPQSMPLATRTLPAEIRCVDLTRWSVGVDHVLESAQGPLHVAVSPLVTEAAPEGKLVLVHDMSFIVRRSDETKRYVIYFFMGLAAVISLITVVIAQLSWRGWVAGMRALLRGEGLLRQPVAMPPAAEFRPIARDLQRLIREMESDVRSRDESQLNWSPDTLRTILHAELSGEDVIVVSNREPYIHQRRGERIEVQRPASGLVTALEPIMRACSGVWIAHGSGSADREVVDKHDRIAVPPEKTAYQLRRVWLSAEEEAGYYYGLANEGLWPLCHIAHVRPTFRSGDWAHYVAVNRKFAGAVIAEAKTKNPIVLVQDYHFALLPRMIRDELPDATVITFWHIPWPNPESFAICPWAEEIVAGLLGSSILGFHTQFHCNNFVDTVDRLLEARVDREAFTVSLAGKLTAVRRYPISIDWPPAAEMVGKPIEQCRAEIRQLNSLPAAHAIGVGVDRLDYTKGIMERFRAVERLLEMKPEWIGRFSFVQIAAPTRAGIDEYQNHEAQVRALATRINQRFSRTGPPPIVLKVEHHEPQQVYEYYRAAEFCFVSSLHDGMNLVAKEFVAARDDERGVLILSQFTGAARELPEALIVNPYDADQCAAALHLALTMEPSEQRDRMRLMRGLVAEFNVYRWAGRMLLDAAVMRRRGRLLGKSAATGLDG